MEKQEACQSAMCVFSACDCRYASACARVDVENERLHRCVCLFVCVHVKVLYIGQTAGLVQKAYGAFCLFGMQQALSLSEQGSKTSVNSLGQLV